MTTPRRELVTDALLALLNAALDDHIGVGDGQAPQPAVGLDRPKASYIIVYPVPGGRKNGAPMSDKPEGASEWIYQVTSVGGSRGHVESIQDLAHKAILDKSNGKFVNALSLGGGARPGLRRHEAYGPGPQRDGDVWTAVELFRIGVGI